MPTQEFWTIGHSTHSAEEFLEILRAHQITAIADVRTIPKSRHNPQFAQEIFAPYLSENSIDYRHFEELGGLRKTIKGSPNGAWRNASFRGYADYMQTPEFFAGIEHLMNWVGQRRVAMMCAEAVPWRCHRSLIADALIVRGNSVTDIMGTTSTKAETITKFARVEGLNITYPPKQEKLF